MLTAPIQSDADLARSHLFRVAVALMTVSILGVFGDLFGLTFVWRMLMEGHSASPGWQPGHMALIHLASLGWCLGLVAAAVILSRTRSHAVAVAMCCLALVPILGPLLILGVPVGLWGLVGLMSARVRSGLKAHVETTSPGRPDLISFDTRQQAQARLFPSGLLLAIISAVGLVADGVGVLVLLTAAMKMEGAALRFQLWSAMTLGIHASYVMLLLAGGITLLRGKAPLFSTAAAWLACVPIMSPCYVFSVPIGIWSLWTLRTLTAYAAFAPNAADERAVWFSRRISNEPLAELPPDDAPCAP